MLCPYIMLALLLHHSCRAEGLGGTFPSERSGRLLPARKLSVRLPSRHASAGRAVAHVCLLSHVCLLAGLRLRIPVSLPRARGIKADHPAAQLNYTPRFLERLSPKPASQGQRCSFFVALSRESRLQRMRQVHYLHITAQTGAQRSGCVGRMFHGAPVFSLPKHDSRT